MVLCQAHPARPASTEYTPSVMVVDDSLSMRRYLSQLLNRFGFQVIEARDGRHALEQLDSAAQNIDLFLLDLEMPRMDGFELMETLSADSRFKQTPKVVLSSRSADKHRQRAYDAGARAYLVKPVAEGGLQTTLNELLSHSERY